MDSSLTTKSNGPESEQKSSDLTNTRIFSNPFDNNNIDLLTCYFRVENEWYETQVTTTKKRIIIGNDPEFSEITINEPDASRNQIIIQRFGIYWYIMELGEYDLMSVNGFLNRQAILGPNSKTSLLVGKTPIIFSTQGPKQRPETQSRRLEPGEFGLFFGDNEFLFNYHRPCLIGANPICDLCLNAKTNISEQLSNEPFVAIINNFQECLFVRKLTQNLSVKVDDVETDLPAPILHDSTIKIDNINVGLKFSSDLKVPEEVFCPPDKKNKMKLVQIDKNDEIISTINLNTKKNPLTIGRSSMADIYVNSNIISRKHASLVLYDKSILIEDLYSNNGTFVNGEKIGKKRIYPGDIVDFGNAKFFLCYQ